MVKRQVMFASLFICMWPAVALNWNEMTEVVAQCRTLESALVLLTEIERLDLKPCERLAEDPEVILSENNFVILDLQISWIKTAMVASELLLDKASRFSQLAPTRELRGAIERVAELSAQVIKRCGLIKSRLEAVSWLFVMREVSLICGDAPIEQ